MEAALAVKNDQFSFISDPPPVINCRNGELWILDDGNVELRPHRPDSNLTHCLDVDYDSEATCPEYDKALPEIFSAAKNQKSMVRHWHEFVGYLIQPRRNIPIIVILLGTGNNGKTQLIRTVIRLMGQALVQAQRVEDLVTNKFVMGSLLGKRAFVDDDVRAGIRLPDGMLKTISEAKEVTGELKFKPHFNFVVRAVPVLLCNDVPSLADVSHGMLRRLMVIPFDRTFTKAEEDLTLFERIQANEMPGILNHALRGLARVINRGHRFKYPADVERAWGKFLREANPLPDFIAEQCTADVKARCLLSDFYRRYRDWAEETGMTMTQQRKSIRRNLEHLGYLVKHGNQGATVYGLGLKSHHDSE